MVLLQMTRRVLVVRSHVLQIQVYIVTSLATSVVHSHHALKPMVLLQTTQRANVALHRALQIQVYIVMKLEIFVKRLRFLCALKLEWLLLTMQRVNVELRRARQPPGYIVTSRPTTSLLNSRELVILLQQHALLNR